MPLSIESLESRTLFSTSFLSHLSATPNFSVSTNPGNGDQNPYGVAIVQSGEAGGKLRVGDVLVSNFNNSVNLQGTGSTIVDINSKTGALTTFFQGPTGLGLTTALGILPGGFVLVGALPADSMGNPSGPGQLILLDKNGNVEKTFTDPKLLDGPWDLTVVNRGFIQTAFVSNVLNGTVSRLDFLDLPFLSFFGHDDDVFLLDKAQVASGYMFKTDPTAFVIGPTGLAFDQHTGVLYVASTEDNAIYAVHNASFAFNQSGTGNQIFSDTHLRGPLGLAFAPNGDLLAANGDAFNPDPTQNSEIVEFTKTGHFVDQFQVDPALGGAFGLADATIGGHTLFAAVDDVTNSLDIWLL